MDPNNNNNNWIQQHHQVTYNNESELYITTPAIASVDNNNNPSSSPINSSCYYYLLGPTLATLSILGICTNLISIVILQEKSLQIKCRAHGKHVRLLSSLAICDLATLIYLNATYGFNLIVNGAGGSDEQFLQHQNKIWTTLIFSYVQTTTILFTITINIERFILVVYPYDSYKLSRWGFGRGILFALPVISALLNSTWLITVICKFSIEAEFMIWAWLNLIHFVLIQSVIPGIIINYLNWKIVSELLTSIKQRQAEERKHVSNSIVSFRAELGICAIEKGEAFKNRVKTIRISVVIMIIFGLCKLPLVLYILLKCVQQLFMYHQTNDRIITLEKFIGALEIIAIIMICLNSVVNFIVYYVKGHIGLTFRESCCKVYKSLIKGEKVIFSC